MTFRLFMVGLSAGVWALLHPTVSEAQTRDGAAGALTVSATIDGVSYLHFSPTAIHWEHSGWAAPGLHAGLHEPTQVHLSGPAELLFDWCPIWANGCNTCDGTCGELRHQAISSLPLDLPVFPGPVLRLSFTCRAREICKLTQEPTAANGYTGIIEMNDGTTPGYGRYEAELRYEYEGPRPDAGELPPVVDASSPVDQTVSPPSPPGVNADAGLVKVGSPDAAARGLVPGLAPRGGCGCEVPEHPLSSGEAVFAVGLASLLGFVTRRRG